MTEGALALGRGLPGNGQNLSQGSINTPNPKIPPNLLKPSQNAPIPWVLSAPHALGVRGILGRKEL